VSAIPFKNREIWAWNCVAGGLLVWFVLDTAISLAYRVYFNAAFNALLFAGGMFPLWFTRRYFDRGRPQTPMLWRMMGRLNQSVALNLRRGIGPMRVVLLLTTVGRKSGLPRVTPLQYELIDGLYYIGSARGAQADWFRNIQANPCVKVQLREKSFEGTAEAVVDARRVADFLEKRLERNPIFIGLLLRLEGLPLKFTREDLERFAARKAMVVVKADEVT